MIVSSAERKLSMLILLLLIRVLVLTAIMMVYSSSLVDRSRSQPAGGLCDYSLSDVHVLFSMVSGCEEFCQNGMSGKYSEQRKLGWLLETIVCVLV